MHLKTLSYLFSLSVVCCQMFIKRHFDQLVSEHHGETDIQWSVLHYPFAYSTCIACMHDMHICMCKVGGLGLVKAVSAL